MNCKEVNLVWVERGIIVIMIYIILKNYDKYKNKKIYIPNKNLNIFFSYIFDRLIFVDDLKGKDVIIFNIRKQIKQEGITIDYLSNYNDYIPTNKIWLVPYYDMNDPLILFEHSKYGRLDVDIFEEKFKNFSQCERGNYLNKGIVWDVLFENCVIGKAKKFGIDNLYFIINNFVKNKYTKTIERIYYPFMGFNDSKKEPNVNVIIKNQQPTKIVEKHEKEKKEIKNNYEDTLGKFIDLMNENIKGLNKEIATKIDK